MRCASCGHSNRDRAKFCDQCGHPVHGAPAAGAPRADTPPHLAQRILRARATLLGERKQVTVLFVDVQSSMALAERLGAEAWHKLIDRFFHILNEGVHRYEGTVNQYTGDGMMALFGAPLAHEDHAERACHAALDLCDRLRAFGEELHRSRGLEFSVRMGLNSGEVVVGAIGDDLHMDYTAQGHTVGLAQRVEQLAAPNSACVARATAALVADAFALEDLGEFTLKGVSEPVRVYQLGAAKPGRMRFDTVLARTPLRLVGRHAELDVLRRALDEASAGYGRVLGVVGEPGVGKTRLCLEIVRIARDAAATIAQAHCPAYAANIACLPIRELLRSLFDLRDGEEAETSRRKTRRSLLRVSPAFRAALPLAFEFLEIAEGAPLPLLEEERRAKVAALLRRIVQAHSAANPLVLLIDDAHCIDREGDALLGEIVEALGWTRTLLVVNFRPGFAARWMGVPYYRELSVAPLVDDDADTLLGDLVGNDPSTTELRSRVRDHTGGNPFFIEQVVRSLLERGVLAPAPAGQRRRGGGAPLRRVGTGDDLVIPPTVQALIAARLDRLPEREKLVLQAAAVVGRTFTPAVLAHVVAAELGAADDEGAARPVDDVLGALETAEFIRRGGDGANTEYAFVHPLSQAVAYDAQLAETRARLHIAVTRALRDIHAERLGQYAGLLAHHFAAANWTFEATRWRRRAALHVTSIELPRRR